MRIERHPPDPRLSSAVRSYQTRSANLQAEGVRVPLPARADVILEFYFTAPHLVEIQRTGARERAPWAVAVGPQTFRRVDLILTGRLDVFTVRFHPTGLHRLFQLPMTEVTNIALETEHLLGSQVAKEVHERLAEAPDLAARAAIMDRVLLARLGPPRQDVIAAAAARLEASHGGARLRDLAAASGLSARQFRRAFAAQVGTPPKLYGRILRLNAALDAKRADPRLTWTDIAHQFGWFDQAHLDKDFLALAGDSPTGFLRPAGDA
jgi:AraC-like DNA-binding protein